MKTARLPVALELAPGFETAPKPGGFKITWERPILDGAGNAGVEYLIAGPFPDEIEDGARVGLMGSQTVVDGVVVSIGWRWLTGEGRPVGDEIVVDL